MYVKDSIFLMYICRLKNQSFWVSIYEGVERRNIGVSDKRCKMNGVDSGGPRLQVVKQVDPPTYGSNICLLGLTLTMSNQHEHEMDIGIRIFGTNIHLSLMHMWKALNNMSHKLLFDEMRWDEMRLEREITMPILNHVYWRLNIFFLETFWWNKITSLQISMMPVQGFCRALPDWPTVIMTPPTHMTTPSISTHPFFPFFLYKLLFP